MAHIVFLASYTYIYLHVNAWVTRLVAVCVWIVVDATFMLVSCHCMYMYVTCRCMYMHAGADSLLPYIIYTILLLSPKHMHSNLRYGHTYQQNLVFRM